MNKFKKATWHEIYKEVSTTTDHLLYVDWQNPFRKSHQYLSTNHTPNMAERLIAPLFQIKRYQMISSYTATYSNQNTLY